MSDVSVQIHDWWVFQLLPNNTVHVTCTYSMPQRVGHASLGNLKLLHQNANGSTIVFTHCEQENEIT